MSRGGQGSLLSNVLTFSLITPTAAMLWLLATNKDCPGSCIALTCLTLNT